MFHFTRYIHVRHLIIAVLIELRQRITRTAHGQGHQSTGIAMRKQIFHVHLKHSTLTRCTLIKSRRKGKGKEKEKGE